VVNQLALQKKPTMTLGQTDGNPSNPIPFTVIGGFLGAGKTTLVNHILTQSNGVRYALLVNDFGRVNIDEQLVASHDGQTMALSNGCICCSLADGFVKTMLLLMRQIDRFDHIVVETSGVAEPEKIMDFARLDPLLYPEGIVVLADAGDVVERAMDPQIDTVVRAQLASASLLLLNKTDTVGAIQKERVCEFLAQLNDRAPILHCENANVPLSLLFGQSSANENVVFNGAGSEPPVADVDTVAADGSNSSSENHRIERGQAPELPFTSHSFSSPGPLDRNAFNRFREQLPASVLRAKGLLQFNDEVDRWYLWQRTGRSDDITGWNGQPAERCQLVFIAIGDAEATRAVASMAEKLVEARAASEDCRP